MWIRYFKDLKTGKKFSKVFDNEYEYKQFMIKCRYSKNIRSLGCTKHEC